MSDFSNKCREYLKDTGENVYQLSASSGLDRTSLQPYDHRETSSRY